MKTLIACFSHTGTTKKAAQAILALCPADTFEIRGTKDYGSFAKACAIGGKEIAAKECPAITGTLPDLSGYDRIFLGFPIWYGSYPRIIQTFLNSCDFQGKDVYPFATSTRAGAEKAQKAISSALPGATVHEALRMTEDTKPEEILSWFSR